MSNYPLAVNPVLDTKTKLDAAAGLIQRLRAEIAELRDLIEECEWTAPDDMENAGWCPWCGFSSHTSRPAKHKPDCRVLVALKGEAGRDYLAPADVRVLVKPVAEKIGAYVTGFTDPKEDCPAYILEAWDYMREKGLL